MNVTTTLPAQTGWDITSYILLAAVVVALFGVCVAFCQLKNLSRQIKLLSKSNRANILFELDKKYDDIFDARIKTVEFVNSIKASTDEEKFISELTTKLGEEFNKQDKEIYKHISQVLDFCESVGFFMNSGYIDESDVKGLWVPAFLTWGRWFKSHVEIRQKEEGEEVFKNFMLAYEELTKEQER